jgi:hypothetical protein
LAATKAFQWAAQRAVHSAQKRAGWTVGGLGMQSAGTMGDLTAALKVAQKDGSMVGRKVCMWAE